MSIPNKEMDALEQTIHALLEEHLPSKNKEKSELGEVFTPSSMISTMYDYFPRHKTKRRHCRTKSRERISI